jgi:hypothetical protein
MQIIKRKKEYKIIFAEMSWMQITINNNYFQPYAIHFYVLLHHFLKTLRFVVLPQKNLIFFSTLLKSYIIDDIKQIFHIFTHISHWKIKPLIVTQSICVIFDKKMVFISLFPSKCTMKVSTLEFWVENQVIFFYKLLRKLFLERFDFFKRRTVPIFNVVKRNLIFLLSEKILMNSLSQMKG